VLLGEHVYVTNDPQQSVLALQATTGQELGSLQFGLPLLLTIYPSDALAAKDNFLFIAHGHTVYAYRQP